MCCELSNAELLTFCGLARLLVRLDGHISKEERDTLEAIGPELAVQHSGNASPYRDEPTPKDDGVDRFWNAMNNAAATFPDIESVRRGALSVTRTQARRAIYDALHELAASDIIVDSEWDMLEWLSSAWSLKAAEE